MNIDYKSTGLLMMELMLTRIQKRNFPELATDLEKREDDILSAINKRKEWIQKLDKIVDNLNLLNDTLEDLEIEQEFLVHNQNYDFNEAPISDIQDLALAGINLVKLTNRVSELVNLIDAGLEKNENL